jgi:hypothetical protein
VINNWIVSGNLITSQQQIERVIFSLSDGPTNKILQLTWLVPTLESLRPSMVKWKLRLPITAGLALSYKFHFGNISISYLVNILGEYHNNKLILINFKV